LNDSQRRVIALGFFDGVHRGHQALLRQTAARAAQYGFRPAVFTFDRSPRAAVTGAHVPLLTSVEERAALVRALSPIQEVIVAPFDQALMTMPWDGFVDMLHSRYQAGWLVAGHSFRFGHRNAGTPGLLREKAARLGMGCDVVPAVMDSGAEVSSTRIRALLAQGDAVQAARLLGRPYALAGPVAPGKGWGRTPFHAPTINLQPPPDRLLPQRGVYFTQVAVDSLPACPAVTNVGVRPTVDGSGAANVESHLLGQPPSGAPACCRVAFLQFLRPEHRFPDADALRAQIARDIASAQDYFSRKEP